MIFCRLRRQTHLLFAIKAAFALTHREHLS